MLKNTYKGKLGCWFHERFRTECVLNAAGWCMTGGIWGDLCNRGEKMAPGSTRDARVCLWQDSSWLTVARVFPGTGSRLLHHVAGYHPFILREALPTDPPCPVPDVSVVLPVSGGERIPLLVTVLASFQGQINVNFEVIVVEENSAPVLEKLCRGNIRHLFVHRESGEPYCKSRMLNQGCRVARGKIVVLHDADIVVPGGYLAAIRDRLSAGFDAIRPLRFLFCLDQENTRRYMAEREVSVVKNVADVMQNFPGGSIALRKDAYNSIGGMDERFREWGGEDLEFLDRLNTLRVFMGGFMPAIHLWHPPALRKASNERNRDMTDALRSVPSHERITQLRETMAAREVSRPAPTPRQN